jgi:quercetin dioxygenase-like cupin family protein
MFRKYAKGKERQLVEGVRLKTLAWGDRTLMARFRIREGSRIPPHQHPHEQIGCLTHGRLRLVVDGVEQIASPGDAWCIPPETVHEAEALEDAEALEVFSPVREDYLP